MYVRASFPSLYEASENADAMQANRRAFPRENTSDLAELIIDLTGRKIICMVHNISEGGAMVETSTAHLPTRLILNYKVKNIHKACRVKWIKDNMAGLQFVTIDDEEDAIG